jgi:transketolase
MQIVVPGTSDEFDKLIHESYDNNSPTYFRLSEYENKISNDVSFGKGLLIKTGSKALVVCYGNMLSSVMDACAELDVTILYYTTIAPFDFNLIKRHFNERIIICEPFYEGSTNHLITNALGIDYKYTLINIGIPRQFLLKYGTKEEHDSHLQLNSEGIHDKITRYIC